MKINLKPGVATSLSHTPTICKLPALVENFVGRQIECKTIIEMIHSNRYVSVEGIPGIGKSAVVKHICNMLYDRHVFKDGILYVTLRDCASLEGLFKKVYFSIKAFKFDSKGSTYRKGSKNFESNDLYWEIIKLLKDLTLLIVFDNCRDIIAKDQTAFREFIQDMLEKLPRAKILITCKNSVPLVSDVKSRILKIKKLSNKQTLEMMKLN